jgi:excisionase family DNA binding protein
MTLAARADVTERLVRGFALAGRCLSMGSPRLLALPSEGLLPVREVAARLGVNASTVYRLCAERKLPHVRVSKAIRVDPRALEDALPGLGRARQARHLAPYSPPAAQRRRLGQPLPASPLHRDPASWLIRRRLRELRRAFGLRALAVFGSVARDEAGPTIDVDVLVEFDGPTRLRGR